MGVSGPSQYYRTPAGVMLVPPHLGAAKGYNNTVRPVDEHT